MKHLSISFSNDLIEESNKAATLTPVLILIVKTAYEFGI